MIVAEDTKIATLPHVELWCKSCKCGVSIIGKEALKFFVTRDKNLLPCCKVCDKVFTCTECLHGYSEEVISCKDYGKQQKRKELLDPEFVKIVAQLHNEAGSAGLAKMFEDVQSTCDGWHVVSVEQALWITEPAWNVFAQFGNTEQTCWTYITGSEIFEYCLKRGRQ